MSLTVLAVYMAFLLTVACMAIFDWERCDRILSWPLGKDLVTLNGLCVALIYVNVSVVASLLGVP